MAAEVDPEQVIQFLARLENPLILPDLAALEKALAEFTLRVNRARNSARLRAHAPPVLLRFLHPSSSWSSDLYIWECRGCGGDHHDTWVTQLSLKRLDDETPLACRLIGIRGCVDIVQPGVFLGGRAVIKGFESDMVCEEGPFRLDLDGLNIARARKLFGDKTLSFSLLRGLFEAIVGLVAPLQTARTALVVDALAMELHQESQCEPGEEEEAVNAETSTQNPVNSPGVNPVNPVKRAKRGRPKK